MSKNTEMTGTDAVSGSSAVEAVAGAGPAPGAGPGSGAGAVAGVGPGAGAEPGVPKKMPRYYKYILNAHGVSDYEEGNQKVCDGEITIPENIHLQYFIDPFDKIYTVCLKEGDIEKLCSYTWMPNPAYLYTKDSEPKLPDILLSRVDDCEANTGLYDCSNEEWKEAVGLGPIGLLPASDSTSYFSCLSLVIAGFSIEFAKTNPGDIAILYIAVCNRSLTCRNEDAFAYYPVNNKVQKYTNWQANVKKTELLDTAYEALFKHYLRRGYTRKNAKKELKDLSDEELLTQYAQYLSIRTGGHRIKLNRHTVRKTRRKSNCKKKKTIKRRS